MQLITAATEPASCRISDSIRSSLPQEAPLGREGDVGDNSGQGTQLASVIAGKAWRRPHGSGGGGGTLGIEVVHIVVFWLPEGTVHCSVDGKSFGLSPSSSSP
jgi:hypothetical protein